ncbi:MAG TPA: DUF952 domain-containing protein [Jatrophihabitantaceae bacterium]|nr:DUF952 domain-containing protein [Jatrophihabitantaceae bacterium]
MQIFHVVDRQTWAEATATGEYIPATFAQDGFVHFSFATQVARVANALYRDEPDLIVVEVDPAGLDVVVEDCYESGEQFPHVYRPIPTEFSVAIHELSRSDGGDWKFSVAGAAGPASSDR